VVRASRCSCCHVANTEDVPLKQVISAAHPAPVGIPSRAATVVSHGRIAGFGRLTADATGPPTYLRLRTLQC
jgi:hypothetical protein